MPIPSILLVVPSGLRHHLEIAPNLDDLFIYILQKGTVKIVPQNAVELSALWVVVVGYTGNIY